MRLEKCYFCSSTCYPGKGITFVRNDCKVFKFCRPKCHRSFKKRKNPRRVKWTKAYRKAAGKELAIDPALQFEAKRNMALKYDKTLWNATMEAMKQVQDIKSKREKLHVKNRLKAGVELRKLEDEQRVKKHMNLIQSPAAGMVQEQEAEPVAQTSKEDEQEMEIESTETQDTGSAKKGQKKREKSSKKLRKLDESQRVKKHVNLITTPSKPTAQIQLVEEPGKATRSRSKEEAMEAN